MQRKKPKFVVPESVTKLCSVLRETGQTAWVVGGSIRDLLMGKTPVDWDLASTATPAQVTGTFNRVIPTGIDHGTVTVMMGDDSFEVTTLRQEGAYSDSRHPDTVNFVTDINEDLSRRDFTVNAIAYNPLTDELHDPFNGRDDITNKTLKAVGEPSTRFEEDALRILRGARFAATLEFKIEEKTVEAMLRASEGLNNVSVERKRDELFKLLGARIPSAGFRYLSGQDIMANICGGLHALIKDREKNFLWQRTMVRVDSTPAVTHLRLCALLVDTEGAPEWLETMALDKKTKRLVVHFLAHIPLDYSSSWSDGDVRRHAAEVGKDNVGDLLDLAEADYLCRNLETGGVGELKRRHKDLKIQEAALSIGELAIDGASLMDELKTGPGPHIGKILSGLLDGVIEHPSANTREELLRLARKGI